MKLLSIIIPCYNEQDTINELYCEIIKNIDYFISKDINYEIIYIDDGSTDTTIDKIKKLIKEDNNVHMISFSRNFGKEAAIYAGLQHSKGDYITIMDADLQDPPYLLPELYKGIEEGYESVTTIRIGRTGDSILRSFLTKIFYRLLNKISTVNIVDGTRDYRMMTRKFLDAVLSLSEKNRFTKGIFSWVGFRTKQIEYEYINRLSGKNKWSIFNLIKYAINGIISFSDFTLKLAIITNIIVSILSLVVLIYSIININYTLLLTMILIICMIDILCVSIIILYISNIHKEIKNRPLYIIDEKI